MQDKNSLTILFIVIINGEIELVNNGLGHGLDLFEQLLDIILLTTVVSCNPAVSDSDQN